MNQMKSFVKNTVIKKENGCYVVIKGLDSSSSPEVKEMYQHGADHLNLPKRTFSYDQKPEKK